jgi:uncharacterized protein (DUF1015 family)
VPEIFPFHGWYYNPEQVPELSAVLSPPYDVISREEQERLMRRSPYNFVRIVLNPAAGEERYHQAAQILEEWRKEGIVIRDSDPALYLMAQTYRTGEESVTRTGIITELQLEELGRGILPHERTMEAHIADRYRLMAATHTNPGQIFMCYRDPSRLVDQALAPIFRTAPWLTAERGEGGHYRLWRITDEQTVATIRQVLRDSKVIIADGHHRYRTALRYWQDHPEEPGAERVMVTLVNAYDPGLQILPTHRLVRDCPLDLEVLEARLATIFRVETYPALPDLIRELETADSRGTIRLGMYHRPSGACWLLALQDTDRLDRVFPGHTREFRHFDVNVLHALILEPIFGLDVRQLQDQRRLDFLRGQHAVLGELMDRTNYSVAFLVRPPDLEAVFAMAEAGEILPQKSTYFYPKIDSGLVYRCFGNVNDSDEICFST